MKEVGQALNYPDEDKDRQVKINYQGEDCCLSLPRKVGKYGYTLRDHCKICTQDNAERMPQK